MKKILRLLLLFFAFICLFGCSFSNKPSDNKPIEDDNNVIIDDDENNENNQTDDEQNGNESTYVEVKVPNIKSATLSDAIKAFDLSYDKSLVEKKKNEVIEVIKKASSIEEINKAYDDYTLFNDEIFDKYIVSEVLYDADMSNELISSAYIDLYEMTLEISTAIEAIKAEIAKSPFAHDFFDGYTDEEIEAIASKDIDDNELNSLLVSNKELLDEFYVADKAERDSILKQFIKNNKRIAELNGYNSSEYIKYSDVNDYYRLYSDDEIKNFETYVNDYVFALSKEVKALDYRTTDNDELTKVWKFYKSFENNIDFINSYVKNLGGDFLETYNNLFDSGYYVISSNPKGNSIAYQDSGTNVRVVFFGPGYHDTSTFIHEFGHYYTSTKGTDHYSYDLCEVHSQADEILLRLYFLLTDPGEASKYYEYLFIDNMLETILDGVMIREFEETIYKDDVDSLQDVWNEINKKYDYCSSDDWYELIIDYNNYYISYATSAMGSLVLYAYAKEYGFNEAKEAYFKLCSYDGLGDIEEAFTYAGLPNPLLEETIKDVLSVIQNEMENSWIN